MFMGKRALLEGNSDSMPKVGSTAAEDAGLEAQPSVGGAIGRLQSSLSNLKDGMEQQNKVLHGLQGQLLLKSEELDGLKSVAAEKRDQLPEEKDADVTEQVQTLRNNLAKKKLEIEQIQEALKQKEPLESGLLSGSATSSAFLRVQSTGSPTMSTSVNTAGIEERHSRYSEVETSDIVGGPASDIEKYKSEIADLKLKLKTATQICSQQENHFSNLVKGLEHRLCEAIAGRDELLTLRQHESGTQQHLIKQLQAALQQTKENLELKSEELSECHSRMKSDREELTRILTVLVKVHNVLKNEEAKRGRTNTLTGISGEYENSHVGDLLVQILSNCLMEDETKITEMVMKCQEVERQLKELEENNEAEKLKLIKEYESKITRLETEHAKALDIAANRTLTERDRISELHREIDENRKKYEKTINDQGKIIASHEEKNKAFSLQLAEKSKAYEIQHTEDITITTELQKRLDELQRDKEEMLKNMMLKATSETVAVEKIVSLENQLKEALQNSRTAALNYQENEKLHLGNIAQLKEALEDKSNELRNTISEQKELKLETEKLVALEREEAGQRYTKLEDQHNGCVVQIASLKEELSRKTEECEEFKDKQEHLVKERATILAEKDDLSMQCKNMSEKISQLQEEKSTLSGMIRNNVKDLSHAKTMIDNLQVKLDEREKSLEIFNKQDNDLAELLLKKHLDGESLLEERQQIVGILEEKMHEVDELKEIRNALANKLESKIEVLSDLESTCRSLETKLEVRSNELEVIMEDRNKLVNDLRVKEGELVKMKDERDSLITLLDGKESEKEREVKKLISRLKGSQHDLALTKKVLEAKREASGKAIKMATMTQEEITAKRKEIDALKDRIKWLQESLQATTEEKAYFENKASEIASELQNCSVENESLKVELDQFMKNYDDACGRVRQMEKALEKAGLKFADSQSLVEKLEQDLAKIKLQYSLEVKELQRRVKSAPDKEASVQVAQSQDLQKVSAALLRESMLRTTKELNATQQRLKDEAEMTQGFKILLRDLHQLMSDIKDSGGILTKTNPVVERSTSTVDIIVPPLGSDGEQPGVASEHPAKSSIKSLENHKTVGLHVNSPSSEKLKTMETSSNSQAKEKPDSDRLKFTKVKAPLRSSSPKNLSPDVNFDKSDKPVFEYSVSDISDVESESSESKQGRRAANFPEDQNYFEMPKRRRSKRDEHKSRNKTTKLKQKRNSSSDVRDSDDVESLIMAKGLEPGSHRRAQKILDLLTLKGQELTTGNQNAVTF